MSETAIGEFIDDGAAQPTRKIIIYERTEVSTNGCENDNQRCSYCRQSSLSTQPVAL